MCECLQVELAHWEHMYSTYKHASSKIRYALLNSRGSAEHRALREEGCVRLADVLRRVNGKTATLGCSQSGPRGAHPYLGLLAYITREIFLSWGRISM